MGRVSQSLGVHDVLVWPSAYDCVCVCVRLATLTRCTYELTSYSPMTPRLDG